ncbi:hypothetical protein ACJX0J_013907, partial [Zea mays]
MHMCGLLYFAVLETHNIMADYRYLDLSYNNFSGVQIPDFVNLSTAVDWAHEINMLSTLKELLLVTSMMLDFMGMDTEKIVYLGTSINAIPDWFWLLNLSDNQIFGALPATLEFMATNTMVLNSLSGPLPYDFMPTLALLRLRPRHTSLNSQLDLTGLHEKIYVIVACVNSYQCFNRQDIFEPTKNYKNI